jgi:lipopolysaccharide/colanic/teichoic acid biosynthesis glycosyltransferase
MIEWTGIIGAMAKRSIDVLGSVLGLVVLAPVLLAVAGVIRVAMGRPVLFRQLRAGRNEVPFELVKFRTMRTGEGTDAERLTALGTFLRSTSLDELPELWNVLRGDMSLVGPRPLPLDYLPFYDDRQCRRHEVRPGLTGLAQVEGRNALDWPTRLELDVRYVEERTLGLDLRILVRTVGVVLGRRGIAAEGSATMEAFTGAPSPEPPAPGRPAGA